MSSIKRGLCLILTIMMIFGLCACNPETNHNHPDTGLGNGSPDGSSGTWHPNPEINNNPNTGFGDDLPEVIFGTWHPNPEISNIPIDIYADGTCAIDGQTLSWEVESKTEDDVTLVAGEHYLIFSCLTSSLPILSESTYGYSVKEPALWNHMIEWYDPNSGNAFTLDLEELAQIDANFLFSEDQMVIEVLDGELVTHYIEFTASYAVVVDVWGNMVTYYPIGSGNSSGNNGGDLGDPVTRYVQAMEDLQNVLTGGTLTDNTNNQTFSGAAAIEKLYYTFVSLQNYVDVSYPLSCIRKIDKILISVDQTMDGNTYPFSDFTYDCYGSKASFGNVEAITSGKQLYYHYDNSGNIKSLTVWGLVRGYPIYDDNGNLTALDVSSADTSKRYTSSVTLDKKGNIVRIDVPFVLNEGLETGCNQVYEFLYDANGRLIQYTRTKYSTGGTYESTYFYKANGFYAKVITECQYNPEGKLITSIEHSNYINASGQGFWSYSPTQFAYDADGLLSTATFNFGGITYSGLSKEEKEEMDRIHYALFHHNGLVDSIAQELLTLTDGRLKIKELVRYEYKYGTIYIYSPQE